MDRFQNPSFTVARSGDFSRLPQSKADAGNRAWIAVVAGLFWVCGLTTGYSQGGGSTGNTVGLLENRDGAYQGYTLFAPMGYTHTYLIDMQGRVVNRWVSAYTTGGGPLLLPNGNLLRPAVTPSPHFQAGGAAGTLEEFDWNGNPVWSYTHSNSIRRQHHEAIKLPNGNVMFISWVKKSSAEAIAAGRKPTLLTEGEVWSDEIVEIRPQGSTGGTIVWRWDAWDHLIQDYDSTKANFGVVAENPGKIDINFARNGAADWLHINGLDYNPELNQIVVSSPFLNEIWIIDRGTTTEEAATDTGGMRGRGGDLLYRWGNPAAYDAGSTTNQRLFGQHNPQWIRPGLPGAGRILVFNNGGGRPGGNHSSVDEIEPPLNAPGRYTLGTTGRYGPTDAVWSYRANPTASFYASFISGAQRLANGNTLVCHGPQGLFFEVAPDGEEFWRYKAPIGANGPVMQGTVLGGPSVFRALRYPLHYAAFQGRELFPQGPLEGNPGSIFQVFSIDREPTATKLRWNSEPDLTYQVFHNPGLNPDMWTLIASLEAIGTETSFTDPSTERNSLGKGFYQVMRVSD